MKPTQRRSARPYLLSGQRVYLRDLVRGDEEEFLTSVRRSRKLHRSWVTPAASPGAFQQLLERNQLEDFKSLLVCLCEDDRLIGVYNLSQIFRRSFQNACLGYWAFEPFSRRGLMREGLWLVLKYAFQKQRLHRLEANIQPGNAASKALVRACGFRREGFSPRYLKIAGRWRDHERWAICREDWREIERKHRR